MTFADTNKIKYNLVSFENISAKAFLDTILQQQNQWAINALTFPYTKVHSMPMVSSYEMTCFWKGTYSWYKFFQLLANILK